MGCGLSQTPLSVSFQANAGWVVVPISAGSLQPRDQTSPCIWVDCSSLRHREAWIEDTVSEKQIWKSVLHHHHDLRISQGKTIFMRIHLISFNYSRGRSDLNLKWLPLGRRLMRGTEVRKVFTWSVCLCSLNVEPCGVPVLSPGFLEYSITISWG